MIEKNNTSGNHIIPLKPENPTNTTHKGIISEAEDERGDKKILIVNYILHLHQKEIILKDKNSLKEKIAA
jgi:hypothetical protein